MVLYHLIILALIQGITEFLPISSSGHLVLAHAMMDEEAYSKNDLLIDVAVHVGTLFSVLLYFRRDVWAMMGGGICMLKGDFKAQQTRLPLFVVLGSIPVIVAGFILHQFDPAFIRNIEIVAWMTLIFGIVLWVVDVKYTDQRQIESLTFKDAALIGLSQILALIPGTSRSGITMIAGRMLGFSRTEAARFSLLLGIVAIAGAGTLGALDLMKSGDLTLTFDALIAMGLAFISGWAAIALMMKWLERASFTPFAIYRIILGVVLLTGIYAGWL